jgi:hypothetical protein
MTMAALRDPRIHKRYVPETRVARSGGPAEPFGGLKGKLELAISNIFDYKSVITNQGCADVRSYKSRVGPYRP